MKCFSRKLAALALGGSAMFIMQVMPGTARAQADRPATNPSSTAEQTIARLGDPDPAAREQAAETLRALGAAAKPALARAAQSDDPEIAWRARQILIESSAIALPKVVLEGSDAPEIIRYRASAPAAKQQIIDDLAAQDNARLLARLWEMERDVRLRGNIFGALQKDATGAATAFMIDGNLASAELLLESQVNAHVPESDRAYVAYSLCRGKIEQGIERWVDRGTRQPGDPWARQMLALLERAAGHDAAAREYARGGDARSFESIELATADWRGLSGALHDGQPTPRPARHLARAIVMDDLSGDSTALAKDVLRLRGMALGAADVRAAAAALLLTNHVNEAIELYLNARDYAAAYELLYFQNRLQDAQRLLASHDSDSSEQALYLRCTAAYVAIHYFGDKAACIRLCERAAKENTKGKFPRAYVSIAQALREAGLIDKSWATYLEGIQSAKQAGMEYWLVEQAFPSAVDGVDWAGIWELAKATNPGRPIPQLFDRIRRAFDDSMPMDELMEAINGVDFSSARAKPYEGLCWKAVLRLRAAGQEAQARELADQSAETDISGNLYVHIGDWALERNDLAQAADAYARAWNKDQNDPLPLYLEGWTLGRGGRLAESRERIALAHLLPLGNESTRAQLIRGLSRHGLDDSAAREALTLLRTIGAPSSLANYALEVAAESDSTRRNFERADRLLQRSVGGWILSAYQLPEPRACLGLAQEMHLARARALLAAGDEAAAMRQIAICRSLLPNLTTVPIALVGDLDRAGRHKEADAMFAQWFGPAEARCRQFPNSAYELNETAWLAVECHREMDKALDYATRAVALTPRDVHVIDTLAQVHFERGELDKAIAEMKKCIAIEPLTIRHRQQLARFEAAELAHTGPGSNGVK